MISHSTHSAMKLVIQILFQIPKRIRLSKRDANLLNGQLQMSSVSKSLRSYLDNETPLSIPELHFSFNCCPKLPLYSILLGFLECGHSFLESHLLGLCFLFFFRLDSWFFLNCCLAPPHLLKKQTNAFGFSSKDSNYASSENWLFCWFVSKLANSVFDIDAFCGDHRNFFFRSGHWFQITDFAFFGLNIEL